MITQTERGAEEESLVLLEIPSISRHPVSPLPLTHTNTGQMKFPLIANVVRITRMDGAEFADLIGVAS